MGILPSGMTLGLCESSTEEKDGKIILNIAKGSNLGNNNILSGKVDITFTLGGRSIVKQFTWTKLKPEKLVLPEFICFSLQIL